MFIKRLKPIGFDRFFALKVYILKLQYGDLNACLLFKCFVILHTQNLSILRGCILLNCLIDKLIKQDYEKL